MILPHHEQAERLILGAILLGDVRVSDLALAAEDFYSPRNARVFRAAKAVDESGGVVERITLLEELKRAGGLQDGEISFLADLTADMPHLSNVDSWVQIVQDRAIRRRAIAAANRLLEQAQSEAEPTEAVLAQFERLTADLQGSTAKASEGMLSVRELIERAGGPDRWLAPARVPTVPTPWESLNKVLQNGGFAPGQLILIAARPSVGKSAMAGELAAHAARSGHATALFSLEMSADSLVKRMVSAAAGESIGSLVWAQRYGGESEEARQKREAGLRALRDLAKSRLLIDDRLANNIPAIRRALRKAAAKNWAPSLIVVDYLQLVEAAGRVASRNEAVGEVSRGLKKLAREFDASVVALSQLSRDSAKEGREPELTDLRDSGSLEQDADIVIFLHPVTSQGRPDEPVTVSVLIKKQREGPKCRVPLTYIPYLTKFEEVA